MPSDTKFGLIVGLALVVTVAILFYRGEQPPAVEGEPQARAVTVKPAPATPSSVVVPPPLSRPAR